MDAAFLTLIRDREATAKQPATNELAANEPAANETTAKEAAV